MNSKRMVIAIAVALIGPWTASFAPAGVTWSAAGPFNTNAATDVKKDYYPHLVTDGAGHWVCVWCAFESGSPRDMDILFTRSDDNGASWSAPALLDPFADAPLDQEFEDDFHPNVATDGAGNWVAAWYTYDTHGETLGDSDTDLLVSHSSNHGVTWASSVPLNGDAATDHVDFVKAGDQEPALACDGQGLWVAAWPGVRSNDAENYEYDIYTTHSTDGGATWSAPSLLHPSMASDTGSDGSVAIGTDGAGHWVTVWRRYESAGGPYGTDDDIYVSTSADGLTWSAPAVLNSHAASDALHDRGPKLAVGGDGRWLAVWRFGEYELDYDIMASYSDDHGSTWSDAKYVNANALNDIGRDMYPYPATDGNGNWVIVWETREPLNPYAGTDDDIVFSRSADNGEHWTFPDYVHGYAMDPFELDADDRNAVVAYAGDGQWRAVWGSTYTMGFTIGPDYDMMAAVGTFEPDADHDTDGDVDLRDFARFQDCYAPGAALGMSCNVFDLNDDEVVDSADFASLESLLVGPTG